MLAPEHGEKKSGGGGKKGGKGKGKGGKGKTKGGNNEEPHSNGDGGKPMKGKGRGRGKGDENGKSRQVLRHERPPRSDDTRRQMKIKEGVHCSVRKHSSMGCAIVSLHDPRVRQAILGKGHELLIQGVHVKLKPHFDKETNREVMTDIFVGWGGQVEKSTPLTEASIADYFDVLHEEFHSSPQQDQMQQMAHRDPMSGFQQTFPQFSQSLQQSLPQSLQQTLQQHFPRTFDDDEEPGDFMSPTEENMGAARGSQQQNPDVMAQQQAAAYYVHQQRMMAYMAAQQHQQQQAAAYYAQMRQSQQQQQQQHMAQPQMTGQHPHHQMTAHEFQYQQQYAAAQYAQATAAAAAGQQGYGRGGGCGGRGGGGGGGRGRGKGRNQM